ncbi:hypothetical protein V7306_29140 [Neobacillus vireti]
MSSVAIFIDILFAGQKKCKKIGGNFMWIITRYLESNISLFEFETEEEAREALKNMKGCNILSEVVYFNDPCFQVA